MANSAEYKLVAFDLDGTLAKSKSPIEDDMGKMLAGLLQKYHVAVTSGGKFEQFKKQLIDKLPKSANLTHLHILPTNGASYFRFNKSQSTWEKAFSKELSKAEREEIKKALENAAKKLGLWEDSPHGEVIEDRASQITYSALGQDVVENLGQLGIAKKSAWDPDGKKKKRLRDEVAKALPSYNVATGGLTSVDVTGKGMDKAAGLGKLASILQVDKSQIVYVGDALEPGGNDAIVKSAGYKTQKVTGPKNTAEFIRSLL